MFAVCVVSVTGVFTSLLVNQKYLVSFPCFPVRTVLQPETKCGSGFGWKRSVSIEDNSWISSSAAQFLAKQLRFFAKATPSEQFSNNIIKHDQEPLEGLHHV